MTMPASNINLITDVRNVFMQDSSGNASLNSQKYRDGAGKVSGNVALMDFANKAYGSGREIVRSQEQGASVVRPYHWDQRSDNESISSAKDNFTGIPDIEGFYGRQMYIQSRTLVDVGYYSVGLFYCNRPGIEHTWTFRYANENWDTPSGFWHVIASQRVFAYQSGYLSGSSVALTDAWYGLDKTSPTTATVKFTPTSSHPWVALNVRVVAQSGLSSNKITHKNWNWSVTV